MICVFCSARRLSSSPSCLYEIIIFWTLKTARNVYLNRVLSAAFKLKKRHRGGKRHRSHVLFMAPVLAAVTRVVRRLFLIPSPPALMAVPPSHTHTHSPCLPYVIVDFAELMQPYELLIAISELPGSVFYCVLLHCSVTLQKWQMCPRRTGPINNRAELLFPPPLQTSLDFRRLAAWALGSF